MQPPQRRGGALWGLVGGATLIMLFIVYRIVLRGVNRRIGTRARATTVITGMQFVYFCAVIILLALVGFIAARRARRLEPGISAAAIAGALLALVQLGVAVIDAYHARRHGQPSLGSPVLVAVRDALALTLAAVGAGPETPAYSQAPFVPASPGGPDFSAPPASPYPAPPPADSYPSAPPFDPSQQHVPPDDFNTTPSLR